MNIEKVKIETANTTRAANTSATAASSAADLNGKAVEIACNNILERLNKIGSRRVECDRIGFNRIYKMKLST